MLIELSRQERNGKIKSLALSKENQEYSKYYDYYRGIHFVKSNPYTTDYGKSTFSWISTRNGVDVFDESTDEDKIVVTSNWCRPIVDTIADYTRGVNEDIVVTAETGEVLENEITDIWKENKINILTHEIAYEAGIFGKTYLRLRRRDKGAPIEFLKLDPGSVYEIKNPITEETEGVIYYFAIAREDAKRMFPQVGLEGTEGFVYYAEEWSPERVYKFIDGVQVNEVTTDKLVKDINPYEFIPFYEIPGSIYRNSDISDVIPLNDELNITLTYINEIFRYHAFPIYSPAGNYDGTNLIPEESLKNVKISPKTILNFPLERIEGKGVDESVINHLKQIEQDISITAQVPIKLLTAELDGNLSGVALQRLMSGVIKQAEVRRNYIKEAYKKINKDICKLLGLEEVETDIIFPDIIKIDTNERLDEALKKQTLGISKETIFEELGYDHKEEEGKRQEEFDNSLEKQLRDEDIALAKSNGNQKGNKTIGGAQKKNK